MCIALVSGSELWSGTGILSGVLHETCAQAQHRIICGAQDVANLHVDIPTLCRTDSVETRLWSVVRAVVQEGDGGGARGRQVREEEAEAEEVPREDLAPNVMRGHWQLDPRQRDLWGRLRCARRPRPIQKVALCKIVFYQNRFLSDRFLSKFRPHEPGNVFNSVGSTWVSDTV